MAQLLRSNLDQAKHAYELFAEGKTDEIVKDIFASDIVWVEPETLPEGGTHRGPQAVLEKVFGTMPETWGAETKAVPENWIEAGDMVILQGRFQGKAPKTGVEYDVPFCHVMEFKDGRLAKFWDYTDTAAALKAIQGD